MASLPYPRSQNNSPTDCTDFHRFTESVGGPTEHTEFTEQTGREGLPQIARILTDSLGAWEVPQNPRNSQNSKHKPSVRICEICGRPSLPVYSVNSVNSVGEHLCKSVLWEGRPHATKTILPQIAQIFTDSLGAWEVPQNTQNSQNSKHAPSV